MPLLQEEQAAFHALDYSLSQPYILATDASCCEVRAVLS